MHTKAPNIYEVHEGVPETSSRSINFGGTNRAHLDVIHNAIKTIVLYSADSQFTAFAIVRHPKNAHVCSKWQITLLGNGDEFGRRLRSLAIGSSISLDSRRHVVVAVDGGNIPSVEACGRMLVAVACREVLKSTVTDLDVLRQQEIHKLFKHVEVHRAIVNNYWLSTGRQQGTVAYTTGRYQRLMMSVMTRLEKLVDCGLIEAVERPKNFLEYTAGSVSTSQYTELLQWQNFAEYLQDALFNLDTTTTLRRNGN